MREITGVLTDITVPVKELYQQIAKLGWTVAKVELKSRKGYAVNLKSPSGEQVRVTGRSEADALARALGQVMRKHMMRTPLQAKIGTKTAEWLTKMVPIAQAYASAPLYDSKSAPAFHELGEDSIARRKVLSEYIKMQETDDPEPYDSADDMREDIHKRKHLYISRSGLDHPIWSREQQLAFRAVHDVLGHAVGGGGWDWYGINRAFHAHAALLSAEAQKALFSEIVGRAAYNRHYRSHAPHKIAFLTKYLHDLDQHGMGEPAEHSLVPHRPKLKTSSDINQTFTPDVVPLKDNAYLWHRIDNKDPLDAQGLKKYAHDLDIGLGDLDGPLQKHAVANAMRAAIVDRGDPKWRAIHYQDIHHVAPDVDDPLFYFKVLHDRRNAYNKARGYLQASVSSSKPFEGEIDSIPLAQYLKAAFPRKEDKDILRQTEIELFHMICEEEQSILAKQPDLSPNDLEDLTIKAMQKRIKFITKNSSEKHDYPHYASSDLIRYKGFSHNDIKHIARASKHLDTIHEAAINDVEDGGAGHHFRHTLTGLGFHPRVASSAWMLLAPKTSQLAPIDDDHKLWVGDGDHYQLERNLLINRGLTGYDHVPLGLYSQALKDYARLGPHQRTPINTVSPLNPQPYEEAAWNQPTNWNFSVPEWWPQEQPGPVSPIEPTTPGPKSAKTIPWFIDPEGMVIEGRVSQSLASLLDENGYEITEVLGQERDCGKDVIKDH